MKKNLFAVITAILATSLIVSLSSCKSGKGEQISTPVAYSVDSLLANADTLIDKTVEVKGLCTHICSHGGGKIFLTGSSDKQIIRIEAGETIGSFKPESVNCTVKASGKLVEERIDEAYLQEWEAKLKVGTAEKHGSSGSGCATEKSARNEENSTTEQERIDNFRKQIAERDAKEGKNYLSFYHVIATSYEILDK